MDVFTHLGNGLLIALSPIHLAYTFLGAVIGTAIGVLPGLGPPATVALLLPITYKINPASGVMMLAGIYYGAMYGGSTTSVLLNIPGEAASIATCLDGYQMARQGRAGPALVVAALGSFIGGTISIIALMLFAPPLAKAMLKIGPGEEFSLMVLALIIMSFVSSAPILKTLAMILLGLLIATVGMDPFTAYPRFTFGTLGLANGIDFVPMAIGLFGVSEILMNFEEMAKVGIIKPTFRDLFPRWKDLRDSLG